MSQQTFHFSRASQEETKYKNNLDENQHFPETVGNSPIAHENQPDLSTEMALSIYAAIMVTTIILSFSRSFMFFKVALLASKHLHAKMFHCLLLAPLRFFNSNPCGRIFNRFSKDIGAIDELLPIMLLDTIQVKK